jgi:Peptidase propeptide and YPEB domain
MTFPRTVALALVFGSWLVAPAFAGRPPTPRERAHIEAALLAQGFQRWEEIELDDGHWQVDEAVSFNGREYDLKLDPYTLAIVERD